MYIAKKLIIVFLLIQFVYSCSTTKEIYFAYTVKTYTFDTVKHFFYSNNLISYGDYLFEFKNRINISTTLNTATDIAISKSYNDTIGVYLLSNENKLYYEFNAFSIKNTVIKTGKLADKQFGQKFNTSFTESSSDGNFSTPTKKVINNINCFFSEIVSKKNKEKYFTNQKVILIKGNKFNSLYKVNDIKFPDGNYCIVGFNIHDLKTGGSVLQEIESMRPITNKEKDICDNLIKESKLCIVDTIKGFIKK